MKITTYETKESWHADRAGKITGSTLGNILSTGGISKAQLLAKAEETEKEYKKSWTITQLTGLFSHEEIKAMEVEAMVNAEKKKGYYQLIADKLSITTDDSENAMDRGNRIEDEAIQVFAKKFEKEVNTDLAIWQRDDIPNIAISPDGYIENNGKINEAVEVKCKDRANHAQALVENEIPKEYWPQIKQYFVVNDDLETLYFVMYDPRFIEKLRLNVFEVSRADVQKDVNIYRNYQEATLKEVNKIVAELTS